MQKIKNILLRINTSQEFLTPRFLLCFSESEVPILTIHQAPTVLKGVYC